jgi:DNA-binding FadR family transcriptional regulator
MREFIEASAMVLAAAAKNDTVTDEELAALQALICRLSQATQPQATRAPKRPGQPQ